MAIKQGDKYEKPRYDEIIDRIEYQYLKLDGTLEFPNSFEGDLLKIVYKSINIEVGEYCKRCEKRSHNIAYHVCIAKRKY